MQPETHESVSCSCTTLYYTVHEHMLVYSVVYPNSTEQNAFSKTKICKPDKQIPGLFMKYSRSICTYTRSFPCPEPHKLIRLQHALFLTSILTLSSHLRLGLSECCSSSTFSINNDFLQQRRNASGE